ncbi:ABC transporter ATP-binding protein [Cumulibacter manganitolerans]|uniref:ABC transporter ATP-binding protein n=1 Tax=Cumulibacter manganitolerans TaxID=1884992 RepID=UPI00129678D7|nr:ABC transporter ATP-binding protein [Cumulibacter manganitolerans]
MPAESVIRTSGLTKSYGRTPALEDLTLDVAPGEVFGYLGPNGAGKTTTLRLLMGLLRPTRGRAEVLGRDPWREAPQLHRDIGYVSGETSLYDKLTGGQHVEYLSRLRGEPPPVRAGELATQLGVDLARRTRELSKGNRQKLALLLGMMSSPRLLILDEPTSGLDPLAQRSVHDLLREHTMGGGTVLLSSHVLSEVEQIADRVGILRGGRLIAVERLADLRTKSLHHVRIAFSGPIRREDFEPIPSLRELSVSGSELVCQAPQSALDDLMKAAARHHIVDLDCAEAGLEETFLAYYGAQQAIQPSASVAGGGPSDAA